MEEEEEPLSLQDEINSSEENSNETEVENEEVELEPTSSFSSSSHFRQIFTRIFTLLQTSRADEQVT